MRFFPDFRWSTKPPVGYQLDRSHPLTQGLQAYWLCNENSAKNLYDLTGRFSATGTGGITWNDGAVFDGVGTTYASPPSSILQASYASPFSLSFWFKVPNGSTTAGTLYSEGKVGGALDLLHLRLFQQSGGSANVAAIWCLVRDNAGGGLTTSLVRPDSASLNDGKWHHVVMSWAGTTGSPWFSLIDGMPAGSGTVPAPSSTFTPDTVVIGNRAVSLNNPLLGTLGHGGKWTRALSQTEAANLYEDPYPFVLAPSLRRNFALSTAGPQTISPSAIASAESFGTAVVTRGTVAILPSGIASVESFGTAVVSPGAVTISPAGIASGESFGTQVVSASNTISPAGIGSLESFGTAVVSPGAVTISPTGIGSAESFGTQVVTQSIPQTITVPGIGSAESFGLPTILAQAVGLSVLASAFVVDPVSDGATVANPTAGQWITLDAAWGLSGVAAQAVTTSLIAPGATIDSSYSARTNGHTANAAGRIGVDMGWTPDNKPVYLSTREAAQGYWRLLFPSPGSYTLTLAGSVLPVTVLTAVVPDADPIIPATPTTPQLTRIAINPLNRQASDIWRLQWNAPYPAGGFDLLPAQLGLGGPFFGDVNDTNLYRFTYDPKYFKLHVYSNSGEVANGQTLAFDTLGLFIGVSG